MYLLNLSCTSNWRASSGGCSLYLSIGGNVPGAATGLITGLASSFGGGYEGRSPCHFSVNGSVRRLLLPLVSQPFTAPSDVPSAESLASSFLNSSSQKRIALPAAVIFLERCKRISA